MVVRPDSISKCSYSFFKVPLCVIKIYAEAKRVVKVLWENI